METITKYMEIIKGWTENNPVKFIFLLGLFFGFFIGLIF
jgi:hypothetical protein